MDDVYLDKVIWLMEDKQYGYSGACDAARPALELQTEIDAIEQRRKP